MARGPHSRPRREDRASGDRHARARGIHSEGRLTMRGEGRIFKRGPVWLVAYYAPKNGRSIEHREPALVADRDGDSPRPAKTEAEARRLLKLRLREVAVHKAGLRPFQGPRQERVMFEDLL